MTGYKIGEIDAPYFYVYKKTRGFRGLDRFKYSNKNDEQLVVAKFTHCL